MTYLKPLPQSIGSGFLAPNIGIFSTFCERNIKQKEVLDLVKKKYPEYAWSLRSLSRQLQHFRIKYVDYAISISTVKEAVTKEMEGPDRLLGNKTLYKKIQYMHGLNVPRNMVYDVLTEVNPEVKLYTLFF